MASNSNNNNNNNSSSSSSSGSSRTVSAGSITYPRLPDILELRVVRRPRAQNRTRRPLGIPNPPNHMYACSLCPEKFTTYQALGGHQNAHRRERLLQKCIMTMQYRPTMVENDLQNPNNSSSSNVVYSPSPIRVFYPPVTEFQKVTPHHQPPSFAPKMDRRPAFDTPSPSWSGLLSRPASASGSGSGPGPAPLTTAYRSSSSRWMPYRRPNVGPSAQLPRPVMHEMGAHGHAEPAFPPGFAGARFEPGNSSADPTNIDRKGKVVIIEEVEDEEEDEGKESWGRDLKLWF